MIRFILTATEPKLPKWAEKVFYDPKDGEVYVPGQAGGGSEPAILLALSYDGTNYVREGGHIYAPVSWMEREYPKYKEELGRIKARVTKEFESLPK